MLYGVAQADLKLFNVHQSRLYPQWHSIYKRSIAAARDYEDKGQEEIRALIEEKMNRFKETDLPRIEAAIIPLKSMFSPVAANAAPDTALDGVQAMSGMAIEKAMETA